MKCPLCCAEGFALIYYKSKTTKWVSGTWSREQAIMECKKCGHKEFFK